MINKNRLALIICLIATFVAYEFSFTYTPNNIERPFYFRSKYLAVKIVGILAKFGEKLNIGTHASNLRILIGCITRVIQSTSPHVDILNTEINNVNVRIYEPVETSALNRSVMVYIHGGGYSFGDLNTYDMFLIEISRLMDMVIISVDYRLAPEYPFPIPTEDCYTVINYLLKNPSKFKVDLEKFVIAGDSAGGNAVATIVQRMHKEKLKMPKIQILIYPWLQMFTFRLPSMLHYSHTGLIKATQIDLIKFVAWYLGVHKIDPEVEKNLLVHNHTLLIEDKEKRKLISSYLNTSLIPKEYRNGKEYYNKPIELFPDYELDEQNILKEEKNKEYFSKAFDPRATPLFADHEDLIGLPKAYFLIIEWDSLKDEGILYSERLRNASVEVLVKFYENGFHGIVPLINGNIGYELAKIMFNDLINYLKANL